MKDCLNLSMSLILHFTKFKKLGKWLASCNSLAHIKQHVKQNVAFVNF